MTNILSLKKEVADLKMYINYLEGRLDEKYNGDDIIHWDTVTGLMFSEAFYTSNVDPDAMADFNFRTEGFD